VVKWRPPQPVRVVLAREVAEVIDRFSTRPPIGADEAIFFEGLKESIEALQAGKEIVCLDIEDGPPVRLRVRFAGHSALLTYNEADRLIRVLAIR